uniref:Sulfotransferase domain-containing protein n=1 Tax=Ditylum brightwellii TaxID=49249 RepID=A0A7S1ZXN2_9STRA|mmetsp:Transcript_4236/g.6482  ORF Transcript_4236/g.6482 Transcript_4236/m.6482 type:complete len:303 (+) Transcript_4236:164-1072(+)
MRDLSEKITRMQQEGKSHTAISFAVIKGIFFPTTSSEEELQASPQKQTKLKVFAAGLPRSGTGSLAVALEELGYNPCHGPCSFELASVLAEHYAGLSTNVDIIRAQEEKGYDAQGLDQLGWKLFKEAAAKTDVKVILTEHPRGGKAWAESWSSFVPDHIYYFSQRPFRFMDSMVQTMKLNREALMYLNGTDDPKDPSFSFPATELSASYERHNGEVKKIVPADRLLVFNPTQGWDPICHFLEVKKCPVIDFPHMTDRHMMMSISKAAMIMTWVWPLVPVVCFALGMSILRCGFYSQKKTKVS